MTDTHHAGGSAALRTVDDLPRFDGFDRPDFGSSFDWIADDLFQRDYQGLLRHEVHGVVVYRNSDLWELAGHPDVSHHAELTGSWDEAVEAHGKFLASSTFSMQPPVHQPGKAIIARRLSAVSMKRFMDFAAATVDELVAESCGREEIDFTYDFVKPLLARLWQHVLGLTPEEAADITRMMEDFFRPFLLEPSEEDLAAGSAASERFVDVITEALTREHQKGGHVILDELVADYERMGEVGKPRNVFTHFGVALPDGFNTLGFMTTNTLCTLLETPGALAQVKADPARVSDAWLEGQRLNPVVVATQRQTMSEIEHDGVVLPEGTLLTMLWLFGNRDPEVFDDPNTYRLDRENRGKQTTFGGGVYACPGRPSARLLGEIVIRALTAPGITTTVEQLEWSHRSLSHEPERVILKVRKA